MWLGLIIAFVMLAGSGCAPAPGRANAAEGEVDAILKGMALVDSVEIVNAEALPIEVRVRGNLPDGCTELAEPSMTREGTTFRVKLPTVRPAGGTCTMALVPYEVIIPLETEALSARSYTVNVNGSTAHFEGPVEAPPLPEKARGAEIDLITGDNSLVESVIVLVRETDPVEVQVEVRGNLRDGCTRLRDARVRREGDVFRIALPTVRPADAMCTMALVPFEVTIALDVEGLAAGTYTVDVNGVTARFELPQDAPSNQPR